MCSHSHDMMQKRSNWACQVWVASKAPSWGQGQNGRHVSFAQSWFSLETKEFCKSVQPFLKYREKYVLVNVGFRDLDLWPFSNLNGREGVRGLWDSCGEVWWSSEERLFSFRVLCLLSGMTLTFDLGQKFIFLRLRNDVTCAHPITRLNMCSRSHDMMQKSFNCSMPSLSGAYGVIMRSRSKW